MKISIKIAFSLKRTFIYVFVLACSKRIEIFKKMPKVHYFHINILKKIRSPITYYQINDATIEKAILIDEIAYLL